MRFGRGVSIVMVTFRLSVETMNHLRFRRGSIAVSVVVPAMLAVLACAGDDSSGNRRGGSSELGTMVEAPAIPATFGLGTAPSPAKLAAVDIDANPSGVGLPEGNGTYASGAALYLQKCAACHGAKGEGAGPFPRLIGVEHQRDFAFADDPKYARTIGNYWPYATTLYDYVNRTMPFSAPGSLTPDEVYSLVAFLLAENGIVPRTTVINRETLPRVEMPARNKFVKDDRAGGPNFK